MTRRPTVLVIEDNLVDQERLRRWLDTDYQLTVASTASEGIAAANRDVDCIILDYTLPDADGSATKSNPASSAGSHVSDHSETGSWSKDNQEIEDWDSDEEKVEAEPGQE